MKKIREVVRLRLGCDAGIRQIASACNIGTATAAGYVAKIASSGLSWPAAEALSEEELGERLNGTRQAAVGKTPTPAHQGVDVYDGTKRGQVDAIMTSSVQHVHFWGHGNTGMLFFGFPDSDHLDSQAVLRYARIRSMKHLPKMKSIDIDECLVLSDESLINALLLISEKVSGYEGWTLEENKLSPGIKRTYTKPFTHRPLQSRIDGPQNYRFYSNEMKRIHNLQVFEHPDQ